MERIGGRLGRFAVTGLLGAGGMGQVLRVHDEELGRDVAAKVLLDEADPSLREKFALEARVAGQLEHPSIVPVYEMGAAPGGRPFFVMRQVRGRSLQQMLAGEDPGSLVERLQLFLKVCDGVAYAHSRGVIHRDLKPANVMVGEFGEVQVCDWGLAKMVGGPDASEAALRPPGVAARGTLHGTVLGTPAYMPPEQARGRLDRLDRRSDIYALGAMLYHMLALVPPYAGDDPRLVLAEVLRGEPVPPSAHRPVPWEIEAVVQKAMARRRSQRYETVTALQSDIGRYLDGMTLLAARYSPWQRARKWLRRRRGAVLLAGATALALGLIAGWGWSVHARRKAVERDAHAAREAFAAGRWADALRAAEQAGLQELAARCLARLARERALRQQQLAAARAYRAMTEATHPLRRRIEECRPLFYIAQVDIRRKLDQVEQALAALEAMATDDAAEVWALLGVGRYLVGREEAALDALRRAHRLAPQDGWVNYHLGRIYAERSVQALGNSGIDVVRALAENRRLGALALEHLGRPLAGLDQITLDLAGALRALCSGRLAEARRLCEQGLQAHRGELGLEQFWVLRAFAALDPRVLARLSRLGGFEAYDRLPEQEQGVLLLMALEHMGALDNAIRVCPHFAKAYLARATVKRLLRQWAAAEADLETMLRIHPHHRVALFARSMVRWKLGRHEAALADCRKLLEHQPAEPAFHHHAGVLLFEMKRTEQALAAFNRALALLPGVATWHLNRGAALTRLLRFPEALADIRRAIHFGRRDYKVWYALGELQRALRQPQAARQAYRKALELAPAAERPRIERLIERSR